MSGYTHLNSEERDQICALRSAGSSIRSIARALGRSPSTISRELNRNRQESGAYRARYADGSYLYRRQRPGLLEKDAALQFYGNCPPPLP